MKNLTAKITSLFFLLFFITSIILDGQEILQKYFNPINHADFSDPDVIRVGDDYFMTASSFSNFPGLPILHSKDLINWKIVSYAIKKYPFKEFKTPQHGCGVWAPSIRFHNGEFYIYFGDPDHGIFMTRTKNPFGDWEKIHLVKKAKGWIDPCPFWDDDGNCYLIHAWARSRSGIKHKLTINKLSNDGIKILDDGIDVFCDSINHPTTEGPKLYKRNGYYYIFAPAGGVKTGWQLTLRSKKIYGPYEIKTVLEKGSTKINGPHQGAWVETQNKENWFIHFQDKNAYGRIVHLQPMKWEDDWPIIGIDNDNNGIGEPVIEYLKPNLKEVPMTLQTNDNFDSTKLGLQWQWQANYSGDWISLKAKKGYLRFYPYKLDNKTSNNLYNSPALLMQKFPSNNFSAIVKLQINFYDESERAGLIVFGRDYFTVSLSKKNSKLLIQQTNCLDAEKNQEEKIVDQIISENTVAFIKLDVNEKEETDGSISAICKFSYSFDEKNFTMFGKEFKAKPGVWIGAKLGFFCDRRNNHFSKNDFADFDWIKFN